ncbi:P-loop containing nucleoside triphosphate hydrolase [Pseudocohnilembus persalinus]|uniref:p-loop containing nucleoside triphosphate hydrolase n=1 Tax=Pseudocohnilembus persalinus TaxID=266149 RepID=A0A0V0QBA0_PSEPJ|nr:P-loop containing nucleoside triphosphate hydrolase [Pseudocohnilembus persalinus]|eukprot:KRW99507.1 P-loop containing nucleoside triphosphate hydrolase [Pseudocohnilembus persalinus]
MPRIPKGSKGTLGKSIMKSLNKKKYVPNEQAMQEAKFIHLENNNEILKQQQKQNLASVIDQDNLDEFLVTAEQAEKKYDAERGIRVAKDEQGHEIIYSVNKQDQEMQDFDVQKNKLLQNLRIPRKPKWNTEMTKKELISAENEAFLMWRRGLAQIEKDYYTVHITPYEKNIEVWKQLWRVVERSDILVQIVDGRDPLFYRCEDLESYVKESGSFKQNFLVINKSDLLSKEVRKSWNKYFIENGVDHMFFSAKQEQEKINSQPDDKNNVLFDLDLQLQDQKQENYVNQYTIANRKNLIYSLQQFVKQQQAQRKQQLFNEKIEIMEKKEKGEETKEDNFDEILKNIDDELDLGGAEFLDEAITDNKGKKEQNVKKNPNLVTIGMVGYPNVGKSSVINALCNKKLVGVGNMPGKTKAFQTVFIQDDVLLCDCPGLVFPNAGSTRGEMVLNGVLPIDRIIDYLGPIDLLVSRVPIVVFEQLYSLSIGLNKITADHLLTAYALKKGYVRGKGEPDEAKSAKLILKNKNIN